MALPPPPPDLHIALLQPHHDRAGFSCGIDSLDQYLRTQANQDVRRKANGVFILTEPNRPDVVLGYYTLCATALPQGDVPTDARKHIPRHPLVSAILIGRLAVSATRQGAGLGAILLADATRRAHASASTVGAAMLVVEALNERACAFYEGNGFVRLPDSLRLILPMHVIQRLLEP